MGFGWEGEKVRLVPLDRERHFENALRWVNDPVVTQWLLIGDHPITRLAEETWFDARSTGDPSNFSFAIETLEGEHIGFSGIHQVDYRNGCAETGSLIGEPHLWGKGLGTDAARVRARYLFEVLGLRMAFSGYLEGNTSSQRMMEKSGYVVYGRIPQRYWKRGAWRDHVLTLADRETWTRIVSP